MKNFLVKRKLDMICTICALAFIVLVWLVAYYSVRNDYIVPSLTDTAASFFGCFAEKSFYVGLGMTTLRTAEAFLLSFALAALCAALSLASRIFAAVLKPVMVILRTLPTLAIVLVLLVWTTPKTAPVIVTFLVLFPVMYAQMTAAAGDIGGELREMAQAYSIPKKERVFKIYLPLAAPNVLAQTGADFSLGLKVTVSAEVLASTWRSLGGLMQTARIYVNMPRLAALTVVSVILGLIFDIALSQFERISYRWRGKK